MSTSAAPGTEPYQFVPHVERVIGYRQMSKKFGDGTPDKELQLTMLLLMVELIDTVRGLSEEVRDLRNAPL